VKFFQLFQFVEVALVVLIYPNIHPLCSKLN
jgi:hypothetical protein